MRGEYVPLCTFTRCSREISDNSPRVFQLSIFSTYPDFFLRHADLKTSVFTIQCLRRTILFFLMTLVRQSARITRAFGVPLRIARTRDRAFQLPRLGRFSRTLNLNSASDDNPQDYAHSLREYSRMSRDAPSGFRRAWPAITRRSPQDIPQRFDLATLSNYPASSLPRYLTLFGNAIPRRLLPSLLSSFSRYMSVRLQFTSTKRSGKQSGSIHERVR